MECVRRTSRVTSLRYRAVAPGLSPLAGWRGWLWWACARTHTQHCGGGSRGPRTTTVSLREVVSRQQSVPNPQSRRISSHTDSASRSDHIPKPSHKPSTMFKNHLDMIGRNEPVSKKAKFWQSYVRSLKGSDDIRASDTTHRTPRGIFRPLSDFPELHSTTWPYGKSIYDDPIHASDRISVPGYRYNPIHRETYGYSPRAIYPHQYASLDRYRPVFHVTKSKPYDVDKAWQDHLDRIAKTHSEFPDAYPFSRYPLYLVYHSHPRIDRRPAAPYSPYRDMLDHLDRLAGLDKLSPLDPYDPYYRGLSPTPIKAGLPIYTRGGLAGRILRDLLNPRSSLPLSAITRDPWWWKYPEFRPFNAPYDSWGKSPFFLRDSYLSPVKRTYLWDKHPIRPFAHVY